VFQKDECERDNYVTIFSAIMMSFSAQDNTSSNCFNFDRSMSVEVQRNLKDKCLS